MSVIGKILKVTPGVLVIAAVAAAVWLHVYPPALLRIAAGYSAKIVCSNVFIAGRDPEQVLDVDVQAPGNPILKLMRVGVDRQRQTVDANLLGFIGKGKAAYRAGLGCAAVPDGDVSRARGAALVLPAAGAPAGVGWPDGEKVDADAQDAGVAKVLADPALTGEGMRAIVVVKDGRIVGERYGDGFSAKTPLLGWSMTKTVNAALVGTVIKAGKMSLDQKGLFTPWKGDGRAAITVADLMAMASGLEFNEEYGDVTDVTRMLFTEPDMASFAAAKPLAHDVGKVFSYSSGTAVMLSRLWQDAVGGPAEALDWPRQALFAPLGMESAVLETDEHGTFVGSSYMYATARDWARFGQFLLQDGIWKGDPLLPDGFVAWMHEPSAASPIYGKGQVWIEAPGDDKPGSGVAEGLPADTFWMEGHDGQSVAIIPSERVVVVRLGLTPSKLGYQPQNLVLAAMRALRRPE